MKYINIRDCQSTDWALGLVGDVEYWRELAKNWCISDENVEMELYIRNENDEQALIDLINDFWCIEIVPFNEKSREHIMLERRNR